MKLTDVSVEQVRRGDPDRFLSAMTAPVEMRPRLLTLYAFNLEIARAPWATKEPLVAEMRLQFWIDLIEAIGTCGALPRHDLTRPLAALVKEADLPPDLLHEMVRARRFDISAEPHKTPKALETYIDHTAGHLMWLAALALGAPQEAEQPIRDYAHGAGVAALLRALPQLTQHRRSPLPVDSDAAIAELVTGALRRVARARKAAKQIPAAAAPALRAGWRAKALLERAQRNPSQVLTTGLEEAEFRRKSHLIWISLRGQW